MAFSLLPTVIVDSLTEVTPELLHSMGVKLLMLDFDNTIVPYTTNDPTDTVFASNAYKICRLESHSKKSNGFLAEKRNLPLPPPNDCAGSDNLCNSA